MPALQNMFGALISVVTSTNFLHRESFGVYKILLSAAFFASLLYTIYSVGRAIYNVTLHPLSKFPGPKLRGAFDFPQNWGLYKGFEHLTIKALHDQYGETVRIAPNALSYNNAQGWKDIYGHRPGKKQIAKDWDFHRPSYDGAYDLLFTNDADHSRRRGLLSHAFSESAMHEQEPLLTSFFDLLIQRLREKIAGPENGVVDMVRWYNFTTFDVIGDLCFGESFHALEKGEYHSWITNVFQTVKFGILMSIVKRYPIRYIGYLILKLFPSLMEETTKHNTYSQEKLQARLDRETDRRDFVTYIQRHNNEKGMSKAEMAADCNLLIVAGSETTATLLSGVTYYLLKNPNALKKVTGEVRSTFLHEEDIKFTSAAKLPYLQACLKEGLRTYPPVPSILPRRTGPHGDTINGQLVPADVSVGVHQWSTHHSARNFRKPDDFIPERWLGDDEFANDDRAAVQPFSMGPRNCLGKNLAHAEMRCILVRMLWNFDMELCKDSERWSEQKVFALWDKKALHVKLRARDIKA